LKGKAGKARAMGTAGAGGWAPAHMG
jgi:hypothetical protein